MEVIRPDFIFSYWIFVWWILYMSKILDINPKYAIILGIIENIIMLFMKIYSKNFCSIPSFIIINIFIKIIPLFTVWNSDITSTDLVFFVILFCMYVVWLFFNNQLNIFNLKWIIDNSKVKYAPFEYTFNQIFNIEC